MVKYSLLIFFIVLLLSACDDGGSEPLIVVATPDALDATFRTYEHESGVFSLRIPPEWVPDQLPYDAGIRMQFTAIENAQRTVRLSLTVVNTGQPMTEEAFIQAVSDYQPPSDVSSVPWLPTGELAAMRDGSVRLSGIREYPNLGSRAVNIFLQGNGSYFSALEVDVTDATPESLETLLAVINTYEVNTAASLAQGNVSPPGINTVSGIVVVQDNFHWEDLNGGFNITGKVLNTSDQDLEAIRLTAYLFDETGNQLAERSDILSYDVLSGGAARPFRIRFDTGRPTTAARYEIHVAARQADFSQLSFYGNENFLVGEDEAVYNSAGDLTIRGLVQNNAGQVAESVRVTVAIVNETGDVVATESTFVNEEFLIPGQATPFEITIYDIGGNPFRYELFAQGLQQQ